MKDVVSAADLYAEIDHQFTERGYQLDQYQKIVAQRLTRLTEKFFSTSSRPKEAPRGLYLWGAVGRGKSLLLDAFFAAVPFENKRRVHFHAFFQELHQTMFKHRADPDALSAALDEMLTDCRLLYFDEFHLHDIGDAMLIKRLFVGVFARNCMLLTSSNYQPEELLPDPLLHERFLPSIRLIEESLAVVSLNGEIDYRSSNQGENDPFHAGAYLCPGSDAQRQALALPSRTQSSIVLTVGSRHFSALSTEGRTLQLSFAALCEAATAVMDYLILVEKYDRWIIEELPRMSHASSAAQQRFINLIDVLYDHRCTLFLISEHPIEQIFDSHTAVDIVRVASRVAQLRLMMPEA